MSNSPLNDAVANQHPIPLEDPDEICNESEKTMVYEYEGENNMIKENKLMNSWEWFQRHAFTTIIFIAFGIFIGISASKIIYEREVTKAINMQRFEFKGDIFEVQPSSITKYYDNKVNKK